VHGYYSKEIFSLHGQILTKEIFDEHGLEHFHSLVPTPINAAECDLVVLFKNSESGASTFMSNLDAVVLTCEDENGAEDLTIGYIDEEGYFGHRHGANHLIKSLGIKSEGHRKVTALLNAYRAWHDRINAPEKLIQFVDGDTPYFDADA
jgi:hypothetical protein